MTAARGDKPKGARGTPRTPPPASFDPVAGQLLPRPLFLQRFRRAAAYAFALVGITLAIGMLGYHLLEDIGWLDAFHQSALLLSGMGPVIEMTNVSGKIFDGVYALVCGIILLASTGLLFAPVLHRILHRFHIEDSRDR